MRLKIILFFIPSLLLHSYSAHAQITLNSQDYRIRANPLISDLKHPWAVEWLDSKQADVLESLVITERNGDLLLYEQPAKNQYILSKRLTISDKLFNYGQGGLLDIKKHPNYAQNGWIYLSYSAALEQGANTVLARFKIKDKSIQHWKVLLSTKSWSNNSRHFGSRIVFDQHNHIYISIGDRGERERAQELDNQHGSILRLHDDGTLPKDNPFSRSPAIYSYGHRNPQGLWFDEQTHSLWSHEHGPRGGDELNLILPGENYGWPKISYGNEYWSNLPVSDKTHQASMQQPIHYWTPSIAPSGLIRYTGKEFAKWHGDFLIGSLKFQQLVRIRTLAKDTQSPIKVVHEERLFQGQLGRIRSIYQHHESLYLLTDSSKGQLILLKPVK